jgi:hypothetical protein
MVHGQQNIKFTEPYFICAKHEGKKSLSRCRRGWEDNIKIDVEEMEWIFANWTHDLLISKTAKYCENYK